MVFSSHLYAALLILSGVLAFVLSVLAWQRRQASGGIALFYLMSSMVIWTWTYALHWIFPDYPKPFFWLDSTYFGVVATPVLTLLFALQITHPNLRVTRSLLILFFIEPAVTLLLLWTDPLHHLFYGGFRLQSINYIYDGGPWFWINVVYSYLLLAVSFSLLVVAFIKRRGKIYRIQLGICLVGLGFLFFINILSMLGYHPLPGLDLTPVLFIITGIFFAISLLYYRMLDLVPVAQHILMDQMQDGMIVVDSAGWILDINRAAAALFRKAPNDLIGVKLVDVTAPLPELGKALLPLQQTGQQVTIDGGVPQILDIQVTVLNQFNGNLQGYLISWRDITHLKRIEIELRQANQTLNRNLFEINALKASLEEQVIRDPLTNLFNRRFIENVLPDEFAKAERLAIRISLLMFDIDHFKDINDRWGHEAGDQVLRTLSSKMENSIRKGDWAIRYGGEEFLIILVDTPGPVARDRADYLRKEIAHLSFDAGEENFGITTSTGVAVFPDHGEDYEAVFRAADHALYQAKSLGRNCVVIAT